MLPAQPKPNDGERRPETNPAGKATSSSAVVTIDLTGGSKPKRKVDSSKCIDLVSSSSSGGEPASSRNVKRKSSIVEVTTKQGEAHDLRSVRQKLLPLVASVAQVDRIGLTSTTTTTTVGATTTTTTTTTSSKTQQPSTTTTIKTQPSTTTTTIKTQQPSTTTTTIKTQQPSTTTATIKTQQPSLSSFPPTLPPVTSIPTAASAPPSSSSHSYSSLPISWRIPISARVYITPSKPVISGSADGSPFLDSYTETVFTHNKKMEKVRSPTFGYLEQRQPNVSAHLRAQTIETMSRLHGHWKLQPETMFLSANLLDRYLGLAAALQQNQMQLLGVTCLWVASKHEETWKSEVSVEQCVFALEPQLELAARRMSSSSGYHTSQEKSQENKDLTTEWRKSIQKAEEHMLGQLNFRVCAPTSHTFLVRFLTAARIDESTSVGYMALLLAELCLLSYDMLRYRPSEIAAACLLISIKLYLGNPCYNGTNMAAITGVSDEVTLRVAKDATELAILTALSGVAHRVMGPDGQVAAVAEIGAGAGSRYGNAFFVFEKFKSASRKSVANDLISVNAYLFLRSL